MKYEQSTAQFHGMQIEIEFFLVQLENTETIANGQHLLSTFGVFGILALFSKTFDFLLPGFLFIIISFLINEQSAMIKRMLERIFKIFRGFHQISNRFITFFFW